MAPVVADSAAGDDESQEIQWWDELDPELQSVYETLGYNELIWNTGEKVPVDEVSWEDMSYIERFAVYSLGYTEESWAVAPGEHFPSQPPPGALFAEWVPIPVPATTMKPSLSPTPGPTTMEPSPSPTLKPSPSPTSAVVPSLSPVTSASVPPDPVVSPTDPVPPVLPPTPDELYGDEWWRDLPPDVQAAYAVLGYEEMMWDAGLEPESNDMWWREMSQEMQDAALFLGYTEEMWDADDADAGELLDFSNVTVDTIDEVANTFNIDSNYYNGLDWEELPPQVQDAATTLGYNQKRWDFGGEFSSRFV